MTPRWKIGLAVSGGADSTALLVLLARLQRALSFKAIVLHVNHSLRPDSAADARFVRTLARQFGIPCHTTTVHIHRQKGESLEMAARRVRLDFFARMARKLHLDAIATGHHADDVAETFIMRLARGSGPEGLAGLKRISHVNGITFIRPLLDIRDSALRDFLTREKIAWREDSTNADTSILRNRVRHIILPFLRENLDSHITEHLCKSAAILRGDFPQIITPKSQIINSSPSTPNPQPSTLNHKSQIINRKFLLTIAPSCGYAPDCNAALFGPNLASSCPTFSAYLSRKALSGRTLLIRTRKKGDRISPTGLKGHSRKLQDVYVTAKVPEAIRDMWPLLVDAATDEILWVPGYRIAQSVAVSASTSPSWHITLSPESHSINPKP